MRLRHPPQVVNFFTGYLNRVGQIPMAKKSTLQLVEVSGKPFEMGRQAGRKCAARAALYRRTMAPAVEYYTGYRWERAVEKAQEYLPFAQDFYPDYVEEIRGFAEGSRMPFGELFTMTVHELLSPIGFKGCTDIVANGDVTEDGRVLAGHNEDWSAEQMETVVLLHAKPSGKPEFVCTSYAGLLPSCGMNSAGISLTGNALSPNDARMGIPKMFPVRRSLEAKRIGEAMDFAMPKDRASSYNNIVTDANGEVYSLEGSATEVAMIYAVDGYLVHTNHYTAPKMLRFEADPNAMTCSNFRYNRALRLVEDQLGGITPESMMSIFRDHVNKPGSICRHPDPGVNRFDVAETIFSVVYDLTHREAHVLKGKPCQGEYIKFGLGD